MKRLAFAARLAIALAAGCSSAAPSPAGDEAKLDACSDADGSAPKDLRCTGLYDDWSAKRVAPSVRSFEPGEVLWSDGADKVRYLLLPEGSVIDASDPDEWRFPVGTKAWKEFSVGGRRVETRYFEKVRDDKWVRATYVWSDDGASARREDDGATVAIPGGSYQVPSRASCDTCHKGRSDQLLGFDAIGLASTSARGLTLEALVREGRIAPALAPEALRIPDDATGKAAAALAWMHVNCGVSCHSRSPDAEGQGSRLFLRVETTELARKSVAALAAWRTTAGQPARTPKWSGAARLVPGRPDESLLVRLVESRERGEQMPPLATSLVDARGARLVREWVAALAAPVPRASATSPPDYGVAPSAR